MGGGGPEQNEGRRGGKEKKTHWLGMCWSTEATTGRVWRKGREAACKIIFGSYNIRNGRNGGLKYALIRMAQANMDLGISKR